MIRWLRRIVFSLLGLLVLCALYLIVTVMQVRSAANSDDWASSANKSEAIVVLGAAQYDGKPSPVLSARLDHALELYNEGAAKTIVLTGSKQSDDRFTEAYAGFTYLRGKGVAESALVVVDDGASTWESLSAVKHVLDKRDMGHVILVSSRYHNRRLQGIAGELGLDAEVSPVGSPASPSQLTGEAFRVAVGQVIGYRRLHSLTG